MAQLSDLIIQHPEIDSFKDLVTLVSKCGKSGEIFLELDVKPDFYDTPRNWATKLESVFYWGES